MTLQRSNFTRHRRKPDANQAEVVAALRAAGYAVLDLHRVGEGVPDLLVADERTGHQVLVEIKQDGEFLNVREKEFFQTWPGQKRIVFDAQDAVDKLSDWRKTR